MFEPAFFDPANGTAVWLGKCLFLYPRAEDGDVPARLVLQKRESSTGTYSATLTGTYKVGFGRNNVDGIPTRIETRVYDSVDYQLYALTYLTLLSEETGESFSVVCMGEHENTLFKLKSADVIDHVKSRPPSMSIERFNDYFDIVSVP